MAGAKAQLVTTLLSPAATTPADADLTGGDSNAVRKTFYFSAGTLIASPTVNAGSGVATFQFNGADQASFMTTNAQVRSFNTGYKVSSTLLTAGSTVGSNLTWTGNLSLINAASLSTGYVGLRFDKGGGNYSYAYVQISTSAGVGSLGPGTITILGGAYQLTSNTSVTVADLTVSAIPEPSTYAAIAGSAMLGVAWYRRRRVAGVTRV